MAARRAAADGRTANHRWEDIMTARQEWTALECTAPGMGAAASLPCGGPEYRPAPGGIPGVLAPSAVPDLVQEASFSPEGPLGTPTAVSISPTSVVSKFSISDPAGKISLVRENTNGAKASHLPGTVNLVRRR